MPAFPDVAKIKYEGPDTKNPLAYRHYNPDEMVEGHSMRDHLRFAVCYWHTFRGTGGDPFGPRCAVRPWEDGTDSLDMALKRVDVAFEFMEKLGVPYYCFHDRDVSPEGANLAETNKNLDAVAKKLKEAQQRTGIQLLWGTANLFSNKRFVHGASTSCNADVFAYSAAQVKKALEVTKELGGENYVFWGGREGYMTLWNTDLKRELDHLAKFFHMAVDVQEEDRIHRHVPHRAEAARADQPPVRLRLRQLARVPPRRRAGQGVQVQRRDQPRDAREAHDGPRTGLREHQRHARLDRRQPRRPPARLGHRPVPDRPVPDRAGHADRAEPGRIGSGGLNFDAKVRRESFEPIDLFHAHIGGMDAFAHGLKIAAAIRKDGVLKDIVKQRYASGTAASARTSRAARPTSNRWKPTCSRRATRTRTCPAARN
jgi:xylose isomerase